MPGLAGRCDPRHSLKQLADAIPWNTFEDSLGPLYSKTERSAKPIRLMVGLLLLRQHENLSDEAVVQKWTQNMYYQYFCGMYEFQWSLPYDPTDFVCFRDRIGEEDVNLILSSSEYFLFIQANYSNGSVLVISPTAKHPWFFI